jgi:hypothetical protein
MIKACVLACVKYTFYSGCTAVSDLVLTLSVQNPMPYSVSGVNKTTHFFLFGFVQMEDRVSDTFDVTRRSCTMH